MEQERFEYMTDYPQIYEFPGKSKSTVWKDFGFYKSGDTGYLDKSNAVCRICLALVKYSGNTTNLHTHLAKHRPKQYADMRANAIKFDEATLTNVDDVSFNHDGSIGSYHSPTSDTQSVTCTGTITCVSPPVMPMSAYPKVHAQTLLMNSNHVQDLNNSLFEFLISNLLPPTMVDNAAFRNLMRVADQGYNMPPSRHFSESLIPQYYNETKVKLQRFLRNTENVTVSTDVWVSNVTDTEFVTLVVHLIDPNWQPQSFTLCTLELDHDADRMSAVIQSMLMLWKIPAAPILVTNSDIRIKAATDILGLRNISCLGNAISMAAFEVFSSEGVPTVIEKCRQLIKALNRNGRERAKLRQLQSGVVDDLELDTTLKWTTTFDMLMQVCKKSESITSILQDDTFSKETKALVPNSKELEKVNTIKCVLRPLRTAAKLISDQGPTTASMILAVLRKLEVTMAVKEEDQSYSNDLKSKVLDVLSSLYRDANVRDGLLVSSLLDPRYKDLLFVDAAERKRGKEQLAEEATVIYRNNNGETHVDLTVQCIKQEPGLQILHATGANGERVSGSNDTSSPAKRPRIEPEMGDDDDWLADVVNLKTEVSASKSSLEESVLAEIDRYVSTEQTSTPALQWWKNREEMYPTLSRLVKKYLCITATTVQYDRSVSADVQQKTWLHQRAMLPPDCVDRMVFLNKNFKC